MVRWCTKLPREGGAPEVLWSDRVGGRLSATRSGRHSRGQAITPGVA